MTCETNVNRGRVPEGLTHDTCAGHVSMSFFLFSPASSMTLPTHGGLDTTAVFCLYSTSISVVRRLKSQFSHPRFMVGLSLSFPCWRCVGVQGRHEVIEQTQSVHERYEGPLHKRCVVARTRLL